MSSPSPAQGQPVGQRTGEHGYAVGHRTGDGQAFDHGRNEHGQAVSLFVVLIIGALIMTAGLVIDGGQKIAAASRSEAAAAGAGRAAANAAATAELGGSDPVGPAVLAARAYLAGQPGVMGTVTVANGVVTVVTQATEPTIFLGILGIAAVTGHGSAAANIVPTGSSR